jgi:hypothetical protein
MGIRRLTRSLGTLFSLTSAILPPPFRSQTAFFASARHVPRRFSPPRLNRMRMGHSHNCPSVSVAHLPKFLLIQRQRASQHGVCHVLQDAHARGVWLVKVLVTRRLPPISYLGVCVCVFVCVSADCCGQVQLPTAWGGVSSMLSPARCSQYSESDTRGSDCSGRSTQEGSTHVGFLNKAGTCVSIAGFMVMRFSLSMPKYCLA